MLTVGAIDSFPCEIAYDPGCARAEGETALVNFDSSELNELERKTVPGDEFLFWTA